jgi:hypothetical protein
MICYADDHLAMAALSWFTLVFFSLFYPIFVYTTLKKASTYSSLKNEDGTSYVAIDTDPITEADLMENPTLYKIRDFRRSTFSVAIAPLLVSFMIAVLNVMPISASIQTLLAGMFVGSELAYILIRMPYWRIKPLMFKIIKNNFYLLFTLFFMAILSEQSTRGADVGPVVAFSVVLALLLALSFYGYSKLKRNAAVFAGTQKNQKILQETQINVTTEFESLSPRAATYSIQQTEQIAVHDDNDLDEPGNLLSDDIANSMDYDNDNTLKIHRRPGAPHSHNSVDMHDEQKLSRFDNDFGGVKPVRRLPPVLMSPKLKANPNFFDSSRLSAHISGLSSTQDNGEIV